jgi:hypothetical protein
MGKLGKFLERNVKSAVKDITTAVTAPLQLVSSVGKQAVGDVTSLASTAVKGAGTVAGDATKVLKENPEVAGAVAAALGVPGGAAIGGLLGGMGQKSTVPTDAPAQGGVMEMLKKYWYIPAAVIVFLMMRKKRR